jgi:hypothetical protein
MQVRNINPTAPSQTVWRNETPDTVKIDIFRGPPGPGQRAALDRYVLKPGEEAILPSEHDRAIQAKNENGEVIHGLAPQLTRAAQMVGGKRVELNERPRLVEAIDPHAAARKDAEAKSALAAKHKEAADSALVIAEAEKAKAMAIQAKADAEKARAEAAEAEKARDKADAEHKARLEAKEAEAAARAKADAKAKASPKK